MAVKPSGYPVPGVDLQRCAIALKDKRIDADVVDVGIRLQVEQRYMLDFVPLIVDVGMYHTQTEIGTTTGPAAKYIYLF